MFFLPDVAGDMLSLVGDDAHHAAVVRRIHAGERVDVSDGHGLVAECLVERVSRNEVSLLVERHRTVQRPDPRLVVVQALVKGDRAETALESLIELGVDEVVPWAASRSVVEWSGDRGERALTKWRTTAHEAAKQSRRAWLPTVSGLASTSEVAVRLASAALPVVLHETATEPLAAVPTPPTGDIVVVVGPEGGLTDDELGVLGPAYRMGSTVQRAATAGVAAAAVLLSRTPRWA
jgi:16S rRNA (uracil1498-N3)-methyltransferase